jgi:hypothetical protein
MVLCPSAAVWLIAIRIRRQHLMPVLEAAKKISRQLDNLSRELSKTAGEPGNRDRACELELENYWQTTAKTIRSRKRTRIS